MKKTNRIICIKYALAWAACVVVLHLGILQASLLLLIVVVFAGAVWDCRTPSIRRMDLRKRA